MQFCFLREFLKYPKTIGTVAQSSVLLARAMAREIADNLNVVEFGAGTGSITRQILRHLPPGGRVTCFEINEGFCRRLRDINDPRLKVINDDAGNCEKYVDAVDCVVSGLPLALFTKLQRKKILDIGSRSKRFIQLQYSPILKGVVKNYFSHVEVKFVPLNLPPAFVFVCAKREN